MVAKRSKRKVKATKEPPIRERRRTPEASTAVRGGAKRKAGTVKEDKRTPTTNAADEKNIRKDHDKARRGANRIKPDAQLRRRATRAARSPKNRHGTRAG